MSLLRFAITGNVQGVQLRETIQAMARKKGIKGQAKNLQDGSVEITFLEEDSRGNEEWVSGMLLAAIESTRKKGLLGELEDVQIDGCATSAFGTIPGNRITDPRLEESFARKEFEVVREHELKETVWALQGAGKLFQHASEQIGQLLKYKKSESIERLESVRKELLRFQLDQSGMDDMVCLKAFIADPKIHDKEQSAGKNTNETDLVRNMIDFYYRFRMYYQTKDKDKKEEMSGELVGAIDGLNVQISEKVKSMG